MNAPQDGNILLLKSKAFCCHWKGKRRGIRRAPEKGLLDYLLNILVIFNQPCGTASALRQDQFVSF